LLQTQWTFLERTWPTFNATKRHRTIIKEVNDIKHVKELVYDRLGTIPVFFFLVELFGVKDYSGPYRNVEKGLLLLYQLLTGYSIADMGRFIPSTSFYDMYKEFYIVMHEQLNEQITKLLKHMFSNVRIRILSAHEKNPSPFEHITMFIDGVDTRAMFPRADKPSLYSYKFKKSGYRTQVCIDVNDMILHVSDSLPCRSNPDGVMLTQIDVESVIHKCDCVALDGAYYPFIKRITEDTTLVDHNFSCPIRRSIGVDLSEEEKQYNDIFGGFRSKIEAIFGELGSTFKRFTNRRPKLVELDTFNLQLKLACLLLNNRRFITSGVIKVQSHHMSWLQPGFDFNQTCISPTPDIDVNITLSTKNREGQSFKTLQDMFLLMDVNDEEPISDDQMGEDEYEVEKILKHRKTGKLTKYVVKWKGYPNTSWVCQEDFNETDVINEYWYRKGINQLP
jgi:hypothetical protein